MFKKRGIKYLNKCYDFRKNYDVVLACAFFPSEIFYFKKDLKEVHEFYDKIGQLIRNIGKRPYLPHKEIDLEWETEKVDSVINNIIIPNSDIVIGYLGIDSNLVQTMLYSAQRNRVQIIYLYNDSESLERLKNELDSLYKEKSLEKYIEFKKGVFELIESKDEKELLSKLELSLNRFYENKHINI